jgi:membrane-associated protein
VLAVVNTFFEWLKESSASPWFYLIIFAVAVFDSILPIVPSETLVIIGGVSAGSGSLSIALVIACAASGAFIGDNLSYLIGREASDWVIKRRTRTERGAKQMANIVDQIHERGGMLLITARFIPGGRTLLTLSCGVTRQPQKWFIGWTVVAASVWSLYASLLGFIGGKSFADNHTKAFLIAFAGAFGVTIIVEVFRTISHRLKRKSQISK